MRSKLILFLLPVVVLLAFSFPKNPDTLPEKKNREMVIGFYNVENLFDTIDAPQIKDEEYTPTSKKEWTQERYDKKIADLATAISGMGDKLPAIVGLCEVENKQVVEDLTQSAALANGKYQIVHHDSPDKRGIDVGLIYAKKLFKPTFHRAIAVKLGGKSRPTRDILYVKGNIKGGTELHVFVNHWPSRYGGAEKSEPKRVAAASVLKIRIDSLLAIDPNTAIICMGDFNDYPDNNSISTTLDAGTADENKSMVNLMYGLAETERGSYNYKGHWDFLDQIIISPVLANGEMPMIKPLSTGPKFSDEMVYENEKYKDIKPSRTYGGPKYFGGFSDHLPVATTLVY